MFCSPGLQVFELLQFGDSRAHGMSITANEQEIGLFVLGNGTHRTSGLVHGQIHALGQRSRFQRALVGHDVGPGMREFGEMQSTIQNRDACGQHEMARAVDALVGMDCDQLIRGSFTHAYAFDYAASSRPEVEDQSRKHVHGIELRLISQVQGRLYRERQADVSFSPLNVQSGTLCNKAFLLQHTDPQRIGGIGEGTAMLYRNRVFLQITQEP
ncbi:hypothetical protein AFL94_13815 [Arthrobacter sp. LS16]|nr:hypothetical protein AFL94_13815 [Arthrobacter sp. LS16]